MTKPFRPQLPPRAGYVEVLGEDGVTHVYKPTPETLATQAKDRTNDIMGLLVDQEYRLTLLELGI